MVAPAFRYGSNARRREGTERKILGVLGISLGLVRELSQNRNTRTRIKDQIGINLTKVHEYFENWQSEGAVC